MEKKIRIVEKGLQWTRQSQAVIRISDIAHPVDKTLIAALETAHVKEILSLPVEQMVSANYGQLLATGIVVDRENFPELYSALKISADRLGIKIPYTIISNSIGGINAFATGTDKRPFIVIGNAAPRLLELGELQFIIAHECGHIAMGHMVYHTAGALAATIGGYLPLVGPILANTAVFPLNCWNRCSEITADRIGLLCCRDLRTAQRALLRIVGGLTDVTGVDIEHYIAQSRQLQSTQTLGKLGEYFQSHPIIYKRLEAMECFVNSKLYYQALGQEPPQDRKLLSTEQLNQKVDDLLKVL